MFFGQGGGGPPAGCASRILVLGAQTVNPSLRTGLGYGTCLQARPDMSRAGCLRFEFTVSGVGS